MQKLGDELSSFDLIVALSPTSQREAKEITRFYALQVEYWPIMDPTATGETRDQKLAAYRQARDQIIERLIAKFGPPKDGI
jgi:arsenate reductase